MGRRVGNPALGDATHRLATATLAGQVPGVRVLYLAAVINIAVGLMMGAPVISGLFWGGPTRPGPGPAAYSGSRSRDGGSRPARRSACATKLALALV
jgi:hypothetical protein